MELLYIDKRGQTLFLTNNDYFYLLDIDGQTNAAADISTFTTGALDGDTVVNTRAQPRSITLDLRIKSNYTVEEAKREILSIIKLKQIGTLKWTQENRTVVISGVVESIDMPRWNNEVLMQVTMYCNQPFWEDFEEIIQEIGVAISTHYFTDVENDMLYFTSEGISLGYMDTSHTRNFTNYGDVDTGMEILILALGSVTNPIIYDTDGNYFGVGYGTGDKKVTLSAGETIVITTHKGNKTVKKGNTSLYDKIKPNSTWLQFQTGNNTFQIDSDDQSTENNVLFRISYKQRYV